MRITIIAPFSFGYIDALVERLEAKEDVQVNYFNTGAMKFGYSSGFQKCQNLFLKVFLGKNLKKEFVSRNILDTLESLPKQHIILVVRPDKLEQSLLSDLRGKCEKMISFYFDANNNIPRQESLIPLFDEVYSYEKEDVEKHDLKFITNFIPFDRSVREKGSGVFNISSYDERFEVMKSIAEQLEGYRYPFKIIVRKEDPIPSDRIKVVSDYLSLEEVEEHILSSGILLDIQKDDQQGLSFRVFEALGYDKKLITSNRDVVTYDFYNPANILVIDKKNPIIPEDFLHTPYIPVPEEIKDKYRRDQWISRVFGVS